MKLYTWKDVQRKLFMNCILWENINVEIMVYSDNLEIIVKDAETEKLIKDILKTIFSEKYDKDKDIILLDLAGKRMDVLFEFDEDVEYKEKASIPLFRYVLYQQDAYYSELIGKELSGVPVLSFQSYKGGVGRTLSLLAFARAWSSFSDFEREQKLLIVDADIEAPGITWLMTEESTTLFSYLDLLELIQQSVSKEECIATSVEMLSKQLFRIETEKGSVEHFVLPVYRYLEQLLDMYASPESLATSYNKKYVLAEVLSEIGKRLGADMVLVDLRAGLSDFSAPLLFDPRVKKYLVTSTSKQSVMGTEILLEQLCKGLPMNDNSIIPEIFLTMIPQNIDVQNIISKLTGIYEENIDDEHKSILDNLVTKLPFASELIHLESMEQIMKALKERDFYNNILQLVKNTYLEPEKVMESSQRNEAIAKIHEFANRQITAEGNGTLKILMTTSLSNLIKKFQTEIPNAVIIGAKGSGKTFLYREMLRNICWETFMQEQYEKKINEKAQKTITIVVPLLASGNVNGFSEIMDQAIKEANRVLEINMSKGAFLDNQGTIFRFLEKKHTRTEWKQFWMNLLLKTLGKEEESLEKLDNALKKRNRRMVFLVDGLEEIFVEVSSEDSEKAAVITLCMEVISELKLKYSNIGLLVFIRKDMVRDAIMVNYEQFYSQYSSLELKWSSTEALRLVVWLVNQAIPGFYQERVSIENASKEMIENALCKFWGNKLGSPKSNEANSSRWILAALSDFNGQIQARDIIRFLIKATENTGTDIYGDRYLMPKEIKKAVSECSEDKIDEIKQEIKRLTPIFDKLENASEEQKKLPFSRDTFNLPQEEEKLLIQEGYLKIEKDKYYLPEIIRHALKFKYEKGARPKVLALLLK